MPRGRKDIYKDANGFDKNPQNRNTTGLNRKSFSSFNLKCAEMGIKTVSRDDYYTAITNIMNLTESELKTILDDKDIPHWIRWLINDLGDKKQRAKIMADFRDWLFGKASQNVNIESNLNISDERMTREQAKKYIESIKNSK